jgi:glycosyltransferase involved in cell wall biosynthesis
MTPLISIIIPVFNVEHYLFACLNSIAAQTWNNIEVILVDDGSTDLSGKLCDEYCLNDSRFRAIHQPNAGLGPARNTGFAHSSGKYVMFVDSDDCLSPSALETSYLLLSSGSYDWSMTGFIRTNEAGEVIEPIQASATAVVVTGQEALTRLFFGNDKDRYTFCFAWGKLFRRTVIEGIFAEAFYSGQDMHFCFRVFQKTQRAIFLDNSLYYWRQRSNSITHKNVEKALFHSFQALTALEKETQPGDPGAFRSLYLKKLYRRMVTSRFHLMNNVYSSQFMKEER